MPSSQSQNLRQINEFRRNKVEKPGPFISESSVTSIHGILTHSCCQLDSLPEQNRLVKLLLIKRGSIETKHQLTVKWLNCQDLTLKKSANMIRVEQFLVQHLNKPDSLKE